MRERAELFYPAPRRALPRLDRHHGGRRRRRTRRRASPSPTASRGSPTSEKNARGQVAGIRRGHILEQEGGGREGGPRLGGEAPGADGGRGGAATSSPAWWPSGAATWDRDFLLDQMKRGPKPLELALTLVRWAGEKAKPDLEREPDYQERNRERLGERLERDQKRLAPADRGRPARRPPRPLRRPARGEPRAGRREPSWAAPATPRAIRAKVDDLLARTRVTDLDERAARCSRRARSSSAPATIRCSTSPSRSTASCGRSRSGTTASRAPSRACARAGSAP